MTQNDRVLQYMEDFGSITPMDAFRDLGCQRLAARISDLREKKIKISDEWETQKNRYGEPIRYKRYRLEVEQHGME